MIDTLTIIASTTICLFILLRAVQLDRKLPWFSGAAPSGAVRTAWTPAWDPAFDREAAEATQASAPGGQRD